MIIRTRHLVLSALLASPLLLALDLRRDAITFNPEAGSSVDKELSLTGAMYIDDLLINVDGEEMPAEMLGELLDTALEIEILEEVTDEYVKSADGRPLVLLRTFNDGSISMTAGGESQEPEVSEIIGSTVKFTWNEEEEKYDITYDDGDGDEEELDGLDADMDFTYLRPEDEVKEGATWEVVGMEAFRMFLPGGTLTAPAEGLDEDLGLGELAEEILEPQIEDALEEFTVDCTYKGTGDDGGAQIEFEYEGEVSLDFSELVMAALEEQELGVEVDADITMSLDFEVEGKGTLTWDTEARRASAFEMAADVIILLDAAADIDAQGQSMSAEATLELSGELEYEMSVE